MEETPAFPGLRVVAFVELLNQLVAGLAFDQFAGAAVKNCGIAVGLLVDLMNHAVENRHCCYLPSVTGCDNGVVAI